MRSYLKESNSTVKIKDQNFIKKFLVKKNLDDSWLELIYDNQMDVMENPSYFVEVGNDFLKQNKIPVKILKLISQDEDGMAVWEIEKK